ncbi:unnamed protein product [Arabis nemorensis]|uniref:Pectinesterase inhibitor domain-containing protein n=1 Tax=Arabis nemorensis TaxID=586526 RepID=A0A565B9Y4_9BRAS|nr:unnamed protein product [Arabis nemorensis]
MAFSCATRKVFSILPLLVFLTITPLSSSFSPNDKVRKELLNQLCSKPTIANHFCIAWLNSDPTTYTLNLNSLIDLVLQKTQLFGYKNLAMMKGFVRTTTDPTLKIPYGSCVADYELAIKSIEEAQGFSSSMSYKLASQAAFKAFNSVSLCEAQLQGRKNVPVYVPQSILTIKRMCTIDNVFSIVLTS